MIIRTEIILPPFPRGFHLITRYVEQQLPSLPDKGLLHIFLKHTSAGLSINENCESSVRRDFETIMNRIVPESCGYEHALEGDDDMPAHVKSSLTGQSLMIPIFDARLDMGVWQGIYLCEFRNRGGARHLTLTVWS